MLANTSETPARPARIAAFWLGIQAVWGAVLGISLQARTLELTGADAIQLIGWIIAIGASVAAIVQIVSAIVSDRRRAKGSRRIEFYVVGTVIGAIGIAWFYVAPSFLELMIGYAILQLGLNVAMGAYQAIIPDAIEPQRTGLASSWMAGLQSVGAAVGGALAGLVSQTRIVAGSLIALLLATCAITIAALRGRRLQEIEVRPNITPVANFTNLFGSRLLLYAGFYTLVDYLLFSVKAVSAEASPADVRFSSAVLLLVFTVCGAFGSMMVARASDRSDKRAVVSLGGAGFAGAMACLAFAQSFAALAAVAIVAGVGWGAILAADWALACRILPGRSMATAMAVWNLAILLAQVAAPVLATASLLPLRPSGGSVALRVVFLLASVETSLGILWIWRLPKTLARE